MTASTTQSRAARRRSARRPRRSTSRRAASGSPSGPAYAAAAVRSGLRATRCARADAGLREVAVMMLAAVARHVARLELLEADHAVAVRVELLEGRFEAIFLHQLALGGIELAVLVEVVLGEHLLLHRRVLRGEVGAHRGALAVAEHAVAVGVVLLDHRAATGAAFGRRETRAGADQP